MVCLRVAANYLGVGERWLRSRIEAGDIDATYNGKRAYRIAVSILVDYRRVLDVSRGTKATPNRHITNT
jgi:hypothetical protein